MTIENAPADSAIRTALETEARLLEAPPHSANAIAGRVWMSLGRFLGRHLARGRALFPPHFAVLPQPERDIFLPGFEDELRAAASFASAGTSDADSAISAAASTTRKKRGYASVPVEVATPPTATTAAAANGAIAASAVAKQRRLRTDEPDCYFAHASIGATGFRVRRQPQARDAFVHHGNGGGAESKHEHRIDLSARFVQFENPDSIEVLVLSNELFTQTPVRNAIALLASLLSCLHAFVLGLALFSRFWRAL